MNRPFGGGIWNVTASQSEVLHARYGNKYTGAPKLKKSAGIG